MLRPPRRARSSQHPVSVRLTSYRSPQPASPPDRAAALRQIEEAFRTARRPARPRVPLTVLSDQTARASISPDRLALALPVPPSINHQYATVNGRRVLSAIGRGYKDQVARQVLVALSQSVHRTDLLGRLRAGSLALSVHFYFISPLRRDVDGGLKIAQDALCEALGINDNRITEIHLFKSLDRAQPRIEVSLCTAASLRPPH